MTMNKFANALTSKDARTANNAVSHSTSGNSVLDYFSKAGSYRNRPVEEVYADLATAWGDDAELALKLVFYNRMVTRKPIDFAGRYDNVHRGQGNKDEFVKSLQWLEEAHPETLYRNLWLVPSVGRWSDLWYDSPATGYFHYTNTSYVFPLLKKGLRNEYHRGLIAKYLPKIRSRRNTTNDRHRRKNSWARALCEYMGWSEKDYRKFKSDSENSAHLWQRLMCGGDWDEIDFNLIPGKALTQFVSGNVLQRHGLEDKYVEWIKSQPVAKFNGYPYELFVKVNSRRLKLSVSERYTYNKQFEQLIETAKDSINPDLLRRGVFCALDTSSSMTWDDLGNGLTPYDVCLSLGIYFSSLLEGHFKNHVIAFDTKSVIRQINADNFVDKVNQIHNLGGWGSTNFQSVIDEIVRVRRTNPDIPVEDYPEVLLVVSDMQFNPTRTMETNHEAAMRKLREVGLPEMTIIWWQVNGRYGNDVPSKMNDSGTVLVSGFDGAIVTSILGCEDVVDEETGEVRKANPYEQMVNALDQDLLNKAVVID